MPAHQIATCPGCGAVNGNRRWIQPSNRAGHWLGICRDCERTRNAQRRATRRAAGQVPPITSARLGDRRRFGVEIECVIPGGRNGTTEVRLKSLLPRHWVIGSDTSIGTDGVEVRSPILRGEDGLQQLKLALDAVIEVGGTINRHCGLHVHHEARDLGRAGLTTFVRSWAANQNLIDWLVSPSRRDDNNSYCRRWPLGDLHGLSEWVSGGSIPGGRYRTVNLHSFGRYGTVEVRQHQGTLSYRKVESWIKLTQGLLDSLSGRTRAHGAYSSLQELFDAANVDEDTSAYLLGRAMQFGAGTAALGIQEAVAA